MQYTENYSLKLPGYGDNADVGDLNDNTTSIDALIHANRQIEAPAFSTETAYTAGDMCVYENVLYKFTADKAAGNWDSTKVTATNLADEVTDAAQSGGTEVEANPVEAATADLHKLKVDNTVYGIPDPTVTKTATGNPIELTDSASAPLVKCVTAITGSQDLHGQDKPWVGGAGKNKLPLVLVDIKSANTIGTWSGNAYTIGGVTFEVETDGDNNVVGIKATGTSTGNNYFILDGDFDTAEYAGYLVNGLPSQGSAQTYMYRVSNQSSFVSVEDFLANNSTILNEGSNLRFSIRVGDSYSFPTGGATFYPMVRASGTSADFSPYSNICPITAYTEGEIEVRGKNILNPSAPIETFDLTGAGIYRYGASFEGNKTYTIINATSSDGFYYRTPKADLSDRGTSIQTHANSSVTVTVPSDCILWLFTGEASVWNTYVSDYAVMIGTDTTYEPYTSTTHTTTYHSAIYRGSEDCVNGEVTSEWGIAEFDGSVDEEWGVSASFNTFYIIIPDAQKTKIICNQFDGKSPMVYFSLKVGECAFANTGESYINFHATHNDIAQWKSDLANNPLQVAYTLATTTTSSVTPTNLPIKSLSGYTHIESSTGEMEVEYITDTYQPLVDLIDEAAEQREAYSTDEQEIGTWVDGSKLYQKTYIFSGTGAANPFSTTVDMTGKTITNVIPHYAKYTYNGGTVGYCVGSRLTANNSNVLTVQYNDEAPPTLDVIANLGGSTETYEVCFTLQYVKTSSNNRSLSKGATEGLKADLSEVKGESEESVDKVDKVDEPTETIEEKEENAGESNSENER